jgi:hypothetical protein
MATERLRLPACPISPLVRLAITTRVPAAIKTGRYWSMTRHGMLKYMQVLL